MVDFPFPPQTSGGTVYQTNAALEATFDDVAAAINALGGAVSFDAVSGSFDTLALAGVAVIAASVKGVIIKGRTSSGDGGGAIYKRVTSEPSHALKFRSADTFLPDGTTSAPNGGWWAVAMPRIYAEMAGAVGDGVTDSTTAIGAALDALEAAGGGYLHFGRGTFIANITPAASGRTLIRGIRGERDGTILRAPTAGTFAISHAADREFSVEGITFDGTVGGVTRRGCGIYYGTGAAQSHVVDCRFQNCLIGYARQDSYYGLIDRCRFQSNDLGIFAGTRAAGTEAIVGLVDGGAAAVSITLPTPANVNGHAGNFAVTNTHIQQNRIGIAILPTSMAVPHVRFDKVTIEGHADAGIVATKLNATFADCWTEANNDSLTTTFTLDGVAMTRGTLTLVDGDYIPVEGGSAEPDDGGSLIRWQGGVLAGAKTSERAEVYIDRATVVTGTAPTNFDTTAGGTITGGVVYGDTARYSNILASAPIPALGDGRLVLTRLPMPRGRIWQAQPAGGSVRIANDFTGVGFASARLAGTHAGETRTFSIAGGFWDGAATVLRSVSSSGGNVGFALSDPLNPSAPAGYYAMVFAYKNDATSPVLTINGTGAPASGATIPIPGGNEWATIGLCYFMEAAFTSTPTFSINGGVGIVQTCLFGAFTLVRFDTREAAIKWFESGQLYVAEA